ncbi:MAG: D-alanine--D-alanine ligase, partial [Bacteroidetes bacterium]|nr:D-alanine--D-alanine ligase [Bacteroidota bacterium]
MGQSRKKIGLFTGGFSTEREVALQSAKYIRKHLDSKRYELFIIDVQRENWSCGNDGFFDLNRAKLILSGKAISLDAAYVMIHGSPAENGLLQGYFDLVGIPYTCCSVFSSALTFDKQATKRFLQGRIPMASSKCVQAREDVGEQDFDALGYPLFVKPNKQGSSFGITKVKSSANLMDAIEKARQFDDEVMVEKFISGREFSCGMLNTPDGLRILPLTEIIPDNEFFDYAAKYKRESQEITPAALSAKQTEKVQSYARRIYQHLGCKGLVRADFILEKGEFHFLELNTIPGMSSTSIVPQQAEAAGISPSDLVHWPLEGCLKRGVDR